MADYQASLTEGSKSSDSNLGVGRSAYLVTFYKTGYDPFLTIFCHYDDDGDYGTARYRNETGYWLSLYADSITYWWRFTENYEYGYTAYCLKHEVELEGIDDPQGTYTGSWLYTSAFVHLPIETSQSLSEGTESSDSNEREYKQERNTEDGTVTSDTFECEKFAERATNDSVESSDTIIGVRSYPQSVSNGSINTDSWERCKIRVGLNIDQTVASDSESRLAQKLMSIRYRARSSDKNRRWKTISHACLSGANSSDALEGSLREDTASLSEGSKASDTESPNTTLRKRATDGSKAGNTTARILTLRKTVIADGGKASDRNRVFQTLQQSLEEGSIGSDARDLGNIAYASIIDNALSSDVATSSIPQLRCLTTDTAKASDANTPYRTHRRRVIREGAVCRDTVYKKLSQVDTTTNTVKSGDTDVGRIRFFPVQAETVVVSDTEGSKRRLRKAISNGTVASDLDLSILTLRPDTVDIAKAGNAASRIASLTKATSDGAKASDTISRKASQPWSVEEGASSGNTVRSTLECLSATSDLASSADTLVGVRTWNRLSTHGALSGNQNTFAYTFRTRLLNKVFANDRIRPGYCPVTTTGDGTKTSDSINGARLYLLGTREESVGSNRQDSTRLLYKLFPSEMVASSTLGASATGRTSPGDTAASADRVSAAATRLGSISNGKIASDLVIPQLSYRRAHSHGATSSDSYTHKNGLKKASAEGTKAGSTFVATRTHIYRQIVLRDPVLRVGNLDSHILHGKLSATLLQGTTSEATQ